MSNEIQNSSPEQSVQPNNNQYRYAGFWIRVGASIIDALIFIPISALSIANLYFFKNIFLLIITVIPGLIYKPFMESKYGATLGKMACGIKVINAQGGKLSLSGAYIRFIPSIISVIASLLQLIILFLNPEFKEASYQEMGFLMQRSPMYIISNLVSFFILIDCLIVVFNKQKQALHDMMAKSFCVYK